MTSKTPKLKKWSLRDLDGNYILDGKLMTTLFAGLTSETGIKEVLVPCRIVGETIVNEHESDSTIVISTKIVGVQYIDDSSLKFTTQRLAEYLADTHDIDVEWRKLIFK